MGHDQPGWTARRCCSTREASHAGGSGWRSDPGSVVEELATLQTPQPPLLIFHSIELFCVPLSPPARISSDSQHCFVSLCHSRRGPLVGRLMARGRNLHDDDSGSVCGSWWPRHGQENRGSLLRMISGWTISVRVACITKAWDWQPVMSAGGLCHGHQCKSTCSGSSSTTDSSGRRAKNGTSDSAELPRRLSSAMNDGPSHDSVGNLRSRRYPLDDGCCLRWAARTTLSP